MIAFSLNIVLVLCIKSIWFQIANERPTWSLHWRDSLRPKLHRFRFFLTSQLPRHVQHFLLFTCLYLHGARLHENVSFLCYHVFFKKHKNAEVIPLVSSCFFRISFCIIFFWLAAPCLHGFLWSAGILALAVATSRSHRFMPDKCNIRW